MTRPCPQGSTSTLSTNSNNNNGSISLNESYNPNITQTDNVGNNISTNNNNNSNASTTNNPRKPRKSIKAEGDCLTGLLREGSARVIDANKLGKRLSSEIWSSFGAIQVHENFNNSSIETKTVADGATTLRICRFFVACSRCFSVFKYDGHAYGTTGLVKHVKNCQGTAVNQRNFPSTTTTTTNSSAHTSSMSVPPGNTNSIANGIVRRKRDAASTRAKIAQPSVKYLAKVIEELRSEQIELKQRINEFMNMMGTGYVSHIQIISNDGEKVDETLQTNKND